MFCIEKVERVRNRVSTGTRHVVSLRKEEGGAVEEGLVLGSQLAFLGNPQFLFTAGKKCGVCVLLRGGGGGVES